ncbi:hypothetical protein P8452_10270 [Trifolium repens]|nr:hypothetical protein P8452_10270 [Trifolium repens]
MAQSGVTPDVWSYNIMINGFSLVLLTKMKNNSCIPDAATYDRIIRSLFNKGENDKAEKLLREIIARGIM